MNKRFHSFALQELLKSVSAWSLYHENVPDGRKPIGNIGQNQARQISQITEVIVGDFLAACVPFIQHSQFCAEKSRLHLIQTAVVTGKVMPDTSL